MERRYIYLAAIACSSACILFAIFPWRGFDPGGHWHRVSWIPFVSRPIGVLDVVGNVLLFVPLGASIALHAQRAALVRTGAVAFACSLFGEWAQIYSRYRYPTTQDILLNVTGAVIAAYGVDYLRRRRSRPVETRKASRASEARSPRVAVTYRAQAPPTLINGRGQARVD
jgi:glycopeptide antibiotics resistance protein